MTETPYHTFVQLLYAACFASEACDYFDLRSEQPANASAFNFLLHEQHQTATALVRHIMAHGEEILASQSEPSEPPPDEPPAHLLRSDELVSARHAFLSRYAIEAEAAARALDGIVEPHSQQYRRLKSAHGYSIGNRRLIEQGGPCGCFYCLKTFDASEITRWVDPADSTGDTALCPHCGIDSVLSAKAAPIDGIFLRRMQARWFQHKR